jgi:hypothetical protein
MKFLVLNIIILSLAVPYKNAFALQGNISKIPNGNRVKLGFDKTNCQICHQYAAPTLTTKDHNGFGTDFMNAGQAWGQTLALQDSDGDQYSNEVELVCVDNYTWVSGPCGADFAYIANPGDPEIVPEISIEQPPEDHSTGAGLTAAPNPFNSTVTIKLRISDVELLNISSFGIYNTSGKRVADLKSAIRNRQSAIAWNATGLPSGVYIAKLLAGNRRYTKKLVLNR